MDISELGKKILFELDKDGRASFSAIAKTLGTTPQVVKYNYDQLIEDRIITKFWAFIDYDRAGFPFFWGYWLKLSGISKEKEEGMYTYLRNHPYIPIVMRCDGYADLFIAIIAKDVFEHNKILQGLFQLYGSYISMSEIVVGIGFEKFNRAYLCAPSDKIASDVKDTIALSGGTTSSAKLSGLDRKMLTLLQLDGRMDFTKIAKKVGQSPSLVQKRYHRLVKDGVITKTTFTLNYEKIGMLYYRVLFKIVQFNPERVDGLHAFCLAHPNIVNYVKVMGNWQLMLDIEVKSRTDLRDLLREMKHSFQDIIFQIEINEIYKIENFTQMAIEFPELEKD